MCAITHRKISRGTANFKTQLVQYEQLLQFLCDLLKMSHYLTELNTALIKDPFDQQLEEAVPARPEACLTQLPVCWNELSDHVTGLVKTVDACRAWVPIFELSMVGEAWQCEEETQFAVVLFRWTKLLQSVEALDCFPHGELQLWIIRIELMSICCCDDIISYIF